METVSFIECSECCAYQREGYCCLKDAAEVTGTDKCCFFKGQSGEDGTDD